jgi:hypothetical protein
MNMSAMAQALEKVVYLDHNATSTLHSSAIEEISNYASYSINPSAPHFYGANAMSILMHIKRQLISQLFDAAADPRDGKLSKVLVPITFYYLVILSALSLISRVIGLV